MSNDISNNLIFKKLVNRIESEHNLFLNKIKRKTPEEIVNSAYEIVYKDIVTQMFNSGYIDFTDRTTELLLSESINLLDLFYSDWLGSDLPDTWDDIKFEIEVSVSYLIKEKDDQDEIYKR